MPQKIVLPVKTLAPNSPIKGNTVEFYDEIKAQGGVKDVYFSCDKTYVVAFYRKELDANDKDRLNRIVSVYHPKIFDGTTIGHYWDEMLYLPCGLVEWNGKLGVIVPFYNSRFFFSDGQFKGKEKEGKWFASAKLRNRFLPADQKGTWLTHIHMCLRIARSVRRLHAAGLSHSDLSYKNVLVDPISGRACVIDADELVVPGRYVAGVIGTPDFIAPEVLETRSLPIDDPRKKLPCRETDQHALAVLIYMYLLNRHPLRGGKVWSTDPTEDEELSMGKNAVFIEHPTNSVNRVKVSDLDPRQLPQGDPQKLPYTICGPYLKALFDRAFIDGLHDPSKRPTAAEWETALLKTADLMQPCQNPNCEAHWYVFDNSLKPKCPFCGTEFHGQLPVINFYYSPSHGNFRPENYRLMVYHQQTLYKWHANKFVSANEKTSDVDKLPVGDFHFIGGKWILVNRRLPDMFEILSDGTQRQILVNQSVVLNDGIKILLSKQDGGRLMVVQLVNN